MQTRITQLFGIRHPVFCPGMTYVSNADLVAAVSNAGGLGILAVGHLSPEETRAEIRRTRTLTDKPFGVGVALIMPGATQNAEVAIEEKVPVINFSLGKGDWICARVHAYGGKVIATVVNEKHAKGAERAGVDALLVTGHEAAAHGGDVTSLVLVPAIRQATTLPIIATGGFGTGSGLIAALALGADAIAMGTRFATSKESPVHQRTKDLIISKSVSDTIYNSNFDSMPCRVMKTPTAEKRMAKPLTLWRALWRALGAARATGRPLLGLLREMLHNGFMHTLKLAYFGAATDEIRRAIQDGDHERGIQLIGQVQGLVHDALAVAEIVARVMAEAEAARGRINAQGGEDMPVALAAAE
ncbi:MAG: nitronate monooxygenase [Moraxellaceae bacterium]|jgi:enoyl-[acyl-carrier protein] reductase II|nr:nitronate monooxygenase [Moraxellaceae bacterium]